MEEMEMNLKSDSPKEEQLMQNNDKPEQIHQRDEGLIINYL